MVRRAHEWVANAEKLLEAASRMGPKITFPYRPDDLDFAWRNCLLYDEHTWGTYCSIDQPESEFTKAQWKIKAEFAGHAFAHAGNRLVGVTERITSLVRTDGSARVVLNPMGWPRTAVIHISHGGGKGFPEPDVPWCEIDGNAAGPSSVVMFVKDVPACGYRVLKLGPPGQRRKAESAEGNVIESRAYRIKFDSASGGIASIIDKDSGRELVDAKAPYRLNEYLYVAGGKGTRIVENGPEPKLTISTPQKATLRREKLGDLGERMVIETSAAMTPTIVSVVTVWNDVKRIDIENRLTKTQTYDKEAVYFAFPFAATKPTFRYEIPAGVVCATRTCSPVRASTGSPCSTLSRSTRPRAPSPGRRPTPPSAASRTSIAASGRRSSTSPTATSTRTR